MSQIIITPSIFDDYRDIVCALSTRMGGMSANPYDLNMSFSVGDNPEHVELNRRKFFLATRIPYDRVVWQRQIHSANVHEVRSPHTEDDCDALITNERNLYLAVSVADCLPVFLYDPVHHAIAGIHAGWRGSRSRIVERALTMMSEYYSTRAEDIRAFIGYGASGEHYEVGEEVAKEFPPRFSKQQPNGKFLLDTKSFNESVLLENGVHEKNIEVCPLSTIGLPELLHSYRRDGALSGRMIGVIGLKT